MSSSTEKGEGLVPVSRQAPAAPPIAIMVNTRNLWEARMHARERPPRFFLCADRGHGMLRERYEHSSLTGPAMDKPFDAEAVRRKLDELRAADPKREVFGADFRNYELNP